LHDVAGPLRDAAQRDAREDPLFCRMLLKIDDDPESGACAGAAITF